MMSIRTICATIYMLIHRNINVISHHLKHADGFHKVDRKSNKSIKYWESSPDGREGERLFFFLLKMNLDL